MFSKHFVLVLSALQVLLLHWQHVLKTGNFVHMVESVIFSHSIPASSKPTHVDELATHPQPVTFWHLGFALSNIQQPGFDLSASKLSIHVVVGSSQVPFMFHQQ
jgi:hypothetical protein